uniref:Uncharacterized protein n=1 Tax=Ditylenchus dipsaci TaxID=166011 RepID=A0A915DXG9_9BILA
MKSTLVTTDATRSAEHYQKAVLFFIEDSGKSINEFSVDVGIPRLTMDSIQMIMMMPPLPQCNSIWFSNSLT